ncbi:hypothetical protein [Vampirovibrio sp.]|uniref:hypothetical protein n=1 Tax=Vampirovibrio sp. TaxID=2717857 RepID=UPI003594813E
MSDYENTTGSTSLLKQKLFEALRTSVASSGGNELQIDAYQEIEISRNDQSGFQFLEADDSDASLPPELHESSQRLSRELQAVHLPPETAQRLETPKKEFDDTLSMRGMVPDAQTEARHPAGVPSSTSQVNYVKSDSSISGGSMADLSGYKDLSKAPISFGEEETSISSLSADIGYERPQFQQPQQQQQQQQHQQFSAAQHFAQEAIPQEVDTEFSGNVKTLIRLVNELPDGVTKQTGAQIIRLTMEAMGLSMEDVLSEAQSAQSEMLDAVRANIKKIEEYKTVIRKLETDIKYYQGKANELSEIIDLFILSNTSGGKMGSPEDLNH